MGQVLLWIHLAITVVVLNSKDCHNKEEVVAYIWKVCCYLYATQLGGNIPGDSVGKQLNANKQKTVFSCCRTCYFSPFYFWILIPE